MEWWAGFLQKPKNSEFPVTVGNLDLDDLYYFCSFSHLCVNGCLGILGRRAVSVIMHCVIPGSGFVVDAYDLMDAVGKFKKS